MNRELELEVTAACIDHVQRKTTDMADDIYVLPTDTYLDADLWTRERTELFQSQPVIAAFSCEVKKSGDYKAIDVAGVPIVVVRREDGEIAAYLNSCRHRGSQVASDRGNSRRLTCPFHGWSYGLNGELANVTMAPAFEGMCREERGLVPVRSFERHGLVWVLIDPRASIDIDEFLGDFGDELARWNLSSNSYVEHRDHFLTANWKLALDTYCEGYHIAYLHKEAVRSGLVQQLVNTSLFATFGDGKFQRQVWPFKGLPELAGRPQDEWDAFDRWQLAFTYVIFPNTVISMVGDHTEMFQLFPASQVGESVTTQTLFALKEELTDQELEMMNMSFELIYKVVSTEDYRASKLSQAGLATGANDSFIFGRNEPALHFTHEAFRRAMGLPSLRRAAPVSSTEPASAAV